MEINYKKNKNSELFNKIISENLLDLEKIQNYIPIYNVFFNLNDTNYNSINLNNFNKLYDLTEKINYSKFKGKIKDANDNIKEKSIFFKYSPLIDPVKYMIGKYETSYNIFEIPKINNNENIPEKFLNNNNSAYVDAIFSFLSSILLNKYNFYNGIDYYGCFTGIKNNFIVDIEEDIEYLNESDFFHENYKKNFILENNTNSHRLFLNNTKKNKPPIIIKNDSNINIDIQEIICHENNCIENNCIENKDTKEDFNELSHINLEYHNTNIDKNKLNKTNNISNTSCSSRYSNTNSNSNDKTSEYSSDDDSDNSVTSYTSEINININKFPVSIISLECCEDTLDNYIINNKIKDDEWESIILQILFTLITYQEVFEMTHNDLHTNNIVYINTDKKYLYYKYLNKHYKVPTFGKIYKIIDFGRAIYRINNNVFCSDSYSSDGDANSQYNCEPYFNSKKPRIEPNYSFDLCRLGCSLFDYFVEDLENIKKLKSPIKKLIIKWIFDDNNKNILYKNNGDERYPDFKLYKMIARIVHNHIPQKVLKNPLFEKYTIAKKKINNIGAIFNIDDLPIMTN